MIKKGLLSEEVLKGARSGMNGDFSGELFERA